MKIKLSLVLSILLCSIFVYLYQKKSPSKVNATLKNEIHGQKKSEISPQSAIYKDILDTRKKLQKPQNEKKSKSQEIFEKAMNRFGTNEYEKFLRDAVELDPDHTPALGHLSEHLLGKNKIDESRKLAKECIARDPKNEVCHRSLISSFTSYGEFDESYQYLKDCLNDVPENIHCNSGLFTYYLSKEQIKDAEDILEQMIKVAPDSLWTIISRGNLAHYKGDLKEASLYFSQACDQKNAYACKMKKDSDQRISR